PGTLDTIASVRQGAQAGFGNGMAALLAAAERPLVQAIQGAGNLVQDVGLVLQQAEREFLLEIVGADVGHVDRHTGQVATGLALVLAQRLVRQVLHVAVEPTLQRQQVPAISFHFRLRHCHPQGCSFTGLRKAWNIPPYPTLSAPSRTEWGSPTSNSG